MIGRTSSGVRGHAIAQWLRAAFTAALLLILAGSWPAQADYVGGLNPKGDNYLSLRSGPGTGYREILRMGPNTIVTVIESEGSWRRIELEDGTVGWASGRYIKSGFPAGYEPEPKAEPETELQLVPKVAFGKRWDSWQGEAGAAVEYPSDLFTPGEAIADGSDFNGMFFTTRSSVDATMKIGMIPNVGKFDAPGLRGILVDDGETTIDARPLANGYVIVASKDDRIFYRKALLSPDGSAITVVELTYPRSLKDGFDPIIGRVAATLTAAKSPPATATAGGGETTTPGGTTEADLERLRLQAEIERLRLEKLQLEQQQAGTTVGPGTPGGTATMPEGPRVALVIGNSAYAAVTPLTTPANDARALGQRLASLGYEVMLGVDKNRREMAELLAQFYAKAPGAAVALFYFSGHGMQIEGRNYLLPIDAVFTNQASFLDVDAQAFDLQKFVAVSSTARISVVFVDACRDNPILEKSLASSLLKGTSVTKGLAVVERESLNAGQFVGFAAEPGKTAETGTGEVSVYTQALLKQLEEPGLDISIMHRRIRTEVEAATDGRQSPRYVDDLADAFALNPAQ